MDSQKSGKEKTLQALEWFQKQDREIQDFAVSIWINQLNGGVTTLVDRCTSPKPTGPGDTPYGGWYCRDGSWVWIAEIG